MFLSLFLCFFSLNLLNLLFYPFHFCLYFYILKNHLKVRKQETNKEIDLFSIFTCSLAYILEYFRHICEANDHLFIKYSVYPVLGGLLSL